MTSHEGPGYPSRAPTEPWSPSSRGLGRRPFKAEARVRIPLGARGRHFGADAQPHICACGGVRSSSSPCQGEDRGIEARQARRSERVLDGNAGGLLPVPRRVQRGPPVPFPAGPSSSTGSPFHGGLKPPWPRRVSVRGEEPGDIPQTLVCPRVRDVTRRASTQDVRGSSLRALTRSYPKPIRSHRCGRTTAPIRRGAILFGPRDRAS